MAKENTYIILESGNYFRSSKPIYEGGEFQKMDIISDKKISEAKCFKSKAAKNTISKLKRNGITAIPIQPFIPTLCYVISSYSDVLWVGKEEFSFKEINSINFFDDYYLKFYKNKKDYKTDLSKKGGLSDLLTTRKFVFRSETKMVDFFKKLIRIKRYFREMELENIESREKEKLNDYISKMDKSKVREFIIDDLIGD